MIFNRVTSIDKSVDLIIPFKKGEFNSDLLFNLTGIHPLGSKEEFSDYQLFYTKEGRRLYILSLGIEKDSSMIREAFRKLFYDESKHWDTAIQIDADSLSDEDILQAALGVEMSTYKIKEYNKSEEEKSGIEVHFVSNRKINNIIDEGAKTGRSINRIKKLIDAPANFKTPEYLGSWALDSASRHGYDCQVMDEDQLAKDNFAAVIAVGKGSCHPPRLIVTSYKGRKNKKAIDLGLVGKGITFDTGGISIKGSQNMHYMKSDMGGAAVVLGAVELAAKLQLKVNIIGVVAAAENAVDANSVRPGDVIDSYSGKSIEIIDTDAEGRLVLADAVNYIIKTHKPTRLIDLATLTGSVVRALGFSAAGLFTNNKEMSESLANIGESIHERVWPLPLYTEFEDELKSDVADIRNLSSLPVAGAITAAKFIEAFTESHEAWAHLDIAGMAFGSSKYTKMKSASGYGVRLITEYMKTLQD